MIKEIYLGTDERDIGSLNNDSVKRVKTPKLCGSQASVLVAYVLQKPNIDNAFYL